MHNTKLYNSYFPELIVMSSVADSVVERPGPPLPSMELMERYYDLVNEI